MTHAATRESHDARHPAQGLGDGQAPRHRLLEPLTDLRGNPVLEVACGTGGFATWLAGWPIERDAAASVTTIERVRGK